MLRCNDHPYNRNIYSNADITTLETSGRQTENGGFKVDSVDRVLRSNKGANKTTSWWGPAFLGTTVR